MPTLTIARQLPWMDPFRCNLVVRGGGLHTASPGAPRLSVASLHSSSGLLVLQQMQMSWSAQLEVLRLLLDESSAHRDHSIELIVKIINQVRLNSRA